MTKARVIAAGVLVPYVHVHSYTEACYRSYAQLIRSRNPSLFRKFPAAQSNLQAFYVNQAYPRAASLRSCLFIKPAIVPKVRTLYSRSKYFRAELRLALFIMRPQLTDKQYFSLSGMPGRQATP